MARDPHGRIVRGEAAAFEKLAAALRHCDEAATGLSRRLTTDDLHKLTGGLRHCIEAITEISTWRSDPRWFALTPAFEQLLLSANQLHLRAATRGGSGVHPARWASMAHRFEKMLQVVTSLWADAERGGVKGAMLS
jgi:hypothetical protein